MKNMDQLALTKSVYTGVIEQDINHNFFCGEFPFDYKMVVLNHKVGDRMPLNL